MVRLPWLPLAPIGSGWQTIGNREARSRPGPPCLRIPILIGLPPPTRIRTLRNRILAPLLQLPLPLEHASLPPPPILSGALTLREHRGRVRRSPLRAYQTPRRS